MLPTEAQWEYACRAGTTTPFSFGATITPEQVNYDGTIPSRAARRGSTGSETVPVASLPANPWGLYEMHGNVWEWCADGIRSYTAEAATDPVGPTDTGASRVVRGGSWSGNARQRALGVPRLVRAGQPPRQHRLPLCPSSGMVSRQAGLESPIRRRARSRPRDMVARPQGNAMASNCRHFRSRAPGGFPRPTTRRRQGEKRSAGRTCFSPRYTPRQGAEAAMLIHAEPQRAAGTSFPGPVLKVDGVTLQYRPPRQLVTAAYCISFAVREGDRLMLPCSRRTKAARDR